MCLEFDHDKNLVKYPFIAIIKIRNFAPNKWDRCHESVQFMHKHHHIQTFFNIYAYAGIEI
jgi:hypothetical protein